MATPRAQPGARRSSLRADTAARIDGAAPVLGVYDGTTRSVVRIVISLGRAIKTGK
jgi:hypothetical protein